MPGTVTLKLTGAKELEEALRGFGPKFTNRVGTKSLFAGAQPIIEEAKRLVPVRTGELRDSITVISAKTGSQAEKKVKVGFQYPAARRAHFTEFGTVYHPAQPFLRPALDSQAQAAIDQITRVLRDGLEDEATFKGASTESLAAIARLGEAFVEESE